MTNKKTAGTGTTGPAAKKPTPAKKVKVDEAPVSEQVDLAARVGAIRPLYDDFQSVTLPGGHVLAVPAPCAFVDVESLDVLASAAIANLAVVTLNARCQSAGYRIASLLAGAAAHNMRTAADRPENAVAEHYRKFFTGDDCASSQGSALGSDEYMFSVTRLRLHMTEQLARMGSTVYSDTQNFWQVQSPVAFGATVNLPETVVSMAMHEILKVMRDCIETGVQSALNEAHTYCTVDAEVTFKIREAVTANFRLMARGPQFDVAALERLMFLSLGIRPASTPMDAFSCIHANAYNGTFHAAVNIPVRTDWTASWYYRAPKDVRAIVDGFRLGLCAVMESRADVDAALNALYRRAREQSRELISNAIERVGVEHFSPPALASLFGKVKTGAHIAEMDVFYDICLTLPILNGSANHLLAAEVEQAAEE